MDHGASLFFDDGWMHRDVAVDRGVAIRREWGERRRDPPRMGRAASRSTTDGESGVAIHHDGWETRRRDPPRMGRATSRSTTDGESDVAIHHDGAGKPPRSLGCDRDVGGGSPFGAGKPPLSVALSLICDVAGTIKPMITTHRGEPRCCGYWSEQRPHISNITLRRGLPPPNVQRPADLQITAQRAAGLASADEMARRRDPSPTKWRDVAIYRRR